jgi:myo-inositol catabolism protein IolC
MIRTQQEIIRQGYKALVDSLGVADTIRFIQYFSPGKGDYTKERHQWLDKISLEDFISEMKKRREDEPNQYEEIIE